MIVPLTVLPTVTTRLIDRYRADMHFKPRLVTGQILGLARMGTLVQMHQGRGMIVSFSVALVLFGVIAVGAQQAIPEPVR
jgi:uncharacterized membrane protein (UPF0136 family)